MNDQTSISLIIPGSTTRTLSPYYDDELTLIHRSYKQKEQEWNKQKIKMEQKIEFLEIQIKEINEREANLKNLNNSIMTAFNDINRDIPVSAYKKIPKEIEILNETHSREMIDAKRRYEKGLHDIEQERDEFKKSLLLSLEEKSKLEKDIKQLMEKNQEYEQRFLKWDENIYMRERYIKESMDTENGVRLKELKNEMAKMKDVFLKEKELIEQGAQRNVENLKNSFEQEKRLLLGKMDALKEEIGLLNKNNSKSNLIYEEIKGKMGDEVQMMRRQKEDLSQKLESAQNANQQLRLQLKESEQSFENKLKVLREEKVLAQEEIKRLKQSISDYQSKIKKIEHSEKTLRTLLNEKESYVDEEKNDLKKRLGNERKKNEQMMEFANKLKEEYNKKHAIIVQEILNKEEEIKKLKNTVSKMTTSARRLEKSQEKSPFRPSCYHQNCVNKTNTLENFNDHPANSQSGNTTSKPTEHCWSCNEQLVIDHPNKQFFQTQENITNQTPLASPKNSTPNVNSQQNKASLGPEKNYDLPLKRDFDTTCKSTLNFSSNNTSMINAHPPNPPMTIAKPQSSSNQPSFPKNKGFKDYSQKLTSIINKENQAGKPKKQKRLTLIDTNKSLLIEPSHDYSAIRPTKEASTTKSKLPSKSPKFNQKPEFLQRNQRNRSVSKQEKITLSTNDLNSKAVENLRSMTPTNNHLTINNMIGVLNLPSSIECTICKKIVSVTDFVEHLNRCAGIYVENPSDSNNPPSHTVFSDISNIQQNVSFNTSAEIPEIEKKTKRTGTIHESIPNEKALNRKMDENFFSLAPGMVLEGGDLSSFVKNESNRYVESPMEVNMTNEFSTSHKKGCVQDNLVNTSFVIKSMNEIKRNAKK